MYAWTNKGVLPTLKAWGDGSQIIFEAGNERAVVTIDGQWIKSVTYADDKNHTVVDASSAKKITVGSDNFKRDVYHFLVPSGPAPTMRLGLTVHCGEGTWSSLPHDFELNLEPDFEEVFFYLLEGGEKKAIQVGEGVWSDNTKVSEAWRVSHKSFSAVPMGYHPVGAEPGVTVAYVWAYLCKHKRWEKVDF